MLSKENTITCTHSNEDQFVKMECNRRDCGWWGHNARNKSVRLYPILISKLCEECGVDKIMSEKKSEAADLENADLANKEHVAELMRQAMDLSDLPLKAGLPQASALLTLAASDLRKNAA